MPSGQWAHSLFNIRTTGGISREKSDLLSSSQYPGLSPALLTVSSPPPLFPTTYSEQRTTVRQADKNRNRCWKSTPYVGWMVLLQCPLQMTLSVPGWQLNSHNAIVTCHCSASSAVTPHPNPSKRRHSRLFPYLPLRWQKNIRSRKSTKKTLQLSCIFKTPTDLVICPELNHSTETKCCFFQHVFSRSCGANVSPATWLATCQTRDLVSRHHFTTFDVARKWNLRTPSTTQCYLSLLGNVPPPLTQLYYLMASTLHTRSRHNFIPLTAQIDM